MYSSIEIMLPYKNPIPHSSNQVPISTPILATKRYHQWIIKDNTSTRRLIYFTPQVLQKIITIENLRTDKHLDDKVLQNTICIRLCIPTYSSIKHANLNAKTLQNQHITRQVKIWRISISTKNLILSNQ